MPLLPHIPANILAATACLGSITCAIGALVFENGYQRRMLQAAVICLGLLLGLHCLAWASGSDRILKPLFTALAFFALWGSYMLIPLMILGGLQESDYPIKGKLGHAALIFSAFICGPVMVPFFLLGDQ